MQPSCERTAVVVQSRGEREAEGKDRLGCAFDRKTRSQEREISLARESRFSRRDQQPQQQGTEQQQELNRKTNEWPRGRSQSYGGSAAIVSASASPQAMATGSRFSTRHAYPSGGEDYLSPQPPTPDAYYSYEASDRQVSPDFASDLRPESSSHSLVYRPTSSPSIRNLIRRLSWK